MASTYTTNLGIEKPGIGEQTGTWGDTANTNYDLIDQAITGIAQTVLAAAGSSGSPNTLPITDGASSVGRNAFIEFIDGGDLGGDAYVQLTPNDAERVIRFRNSLSASRSIYIFQGTYNASNDFVLPNGCDVVIKFDGGGASATATDANQNAFLTGVTFGGQYTETVYALSGTSAALDPDNGTIQTHTLTGNTTYTDSISEGQSVIIMINDGTDYSVTWPTTTWVNNSGVAPTLAVTGYTVIALWKVGSTLYAANVGNG